MDSGPEKGIRRSIWDALFRRKSDLLNVTGYKAGDVDANRPVHISASAVVAGNVKAPQVFVAGMLHGSVITRDLTVVAGGQIWGDVLAVTADVRAGARVAGWLTTVGEEELDAHLAQKLNGQNRPHQEKLEEALAHVAPALKESVTLHEERSEQWSLLNQLQSEAGRALKACAELQHRFEERVQNAAGDAVAQAQELEIALAEAGERIASLEETLKQRPEKWIGHADDEAVHTLARRVESLENALEASVEQNAEQEAALLHWQELAETAQIQIRRLDEQFEQLRAELAEVGEIAQAPQSKRTELARTWARMNAAVPEAISPQDGAEATASAASVPEVREPRRRDWDVVLRQAQNALRDRDAQLLWCSASLTVTQEQLRVSRTALQDKDEQLQAVRRDLARQRFVAEKWKARVGRLSELLYESIQRMKENETALDVLAGKLDEAMLPQASAEDDVEPQ